MFIFSGLLLLIIVFSYDMDCLEVMFDFFVVGQMLVVFVFVQEFNCVMVVVVDVMFVGIVMMYLCVECEDELQNEKYVLMLVYFCEVDVEQGKVLIFVLVGIVLLGLLVGQSMDWDVLGGCKLCLCVIVVYNLNF